MKTPIADFVRQYAASKTARLHMPGHKGISFLGPESLDITEVKGADVLEAPSGIIKESEKNAACLFGSGATFYSAEGSSLAIRGMLALLLRTKKGEHIEILAARNVHKSFVYGAALLDARVTWLTPRRRQHLCECRITAEDLEKALSERESAPDAVFITSPDYLGHVADIEGLGSVCRAHGIPLLVDNAHGAYLAFLEESRHPMALGATLCCDSAHKTLPVLTGGAYLHVAKDAPAAFLEGAPSAMALFASTSPSYLILQSLDLANRYMAGTYRAELKETVSRVAALRAALLAKGFEDASEEPLKLALSGEALGYTGEELSALLRENGMEAEYTDRTYLVLMVTPQTPPATLQKLEHLLTNLPPRKAIAREETEVGLCTPVLTLREAVFAPWERIPAKEALGRISAAPTVSCPPAVPIVMSGERIGKEAVAAFLRYGITEVSVVLK